jgi:cytochrome c oxidase subunit III
VTDHEAEAIAIESPWSGGGSPFAIKSIKLGMWLFILSDSLTFSALLIAYAYVRLSNPNWPRPFEIYPAIAKSTVMTIFLLSSSLTMVLGVAAAHKGQRSKAVRYILFTMLGGALFVILHATEWVHLIVDEHVTPWSNPYGVPLFGGAFFGITGMHMLHVSIGVIYLGIIAWGFGRGKFTSEHVEVSGLYWHFVDLVWMFVFPMIYLMSVSLIKG